MIPIKNIVDLRPIAKGETERIRVAQGKDELPSNFRGIKTKLKKEAKWSKK